MKGCSNIVITIFFFERMKKIMIRLIFFFQHFFKMIDFKVSKRYYESDENEKYK